jgi:hypothetical protein
MVDNPSESGRAHAVALDRRSLTSAWCHHPTSPRLSETYVYVGCWRSAQVATRADRLKPGLTSRFQQVRALARRRRVGRQQHVGCERGKSRGRRERSRGLRASANRAPPHGRGESRGPLSSPKTTAADAKRDWASSKPKQGARAVAQTSVGPSKYELQGPTV